MTTNSLRFPLLLLSFLIVNFSMAKKEAPIVVPVSPLKAMADKIAENIG